MASTLYGQLEQLLKEVAPTGKRAFEEVGGGEPAGQGATGSDTTSPTKSVPNASNPEAATVGSFGQQLSQEVKEQGPGAVDSTPDATPIKAEEIQGEVGLTQSTVGRDPTQEDDYTGKVDEPGVGTSTSAKFDDGEKFASVADVMGKSATDRGAYMSKLANSILADIATAVTTPAPKTAGTPQPAAQPATPTDPETAQKIAEEAAASAQAGYAMAQVLGMHKMSAEQRAQLTIRDTMSEAIQDACMVHAWIQKAAEEEAAEKKPDADDTPPPDAGAAAGASADASAVPPVSPPPPATDPTGGAGAGAGAPPTDPMADAMSQFGGDAGGNQDAGMGGAGDDMGHVDRNELLQGLLMAMQELGVTPEEVMQAAAGNGSPKAAQMSKAAAAARAFQRAGQFQIGGPTTKRARGITNRAKDMLREVFESRT